MPRISSLPALTQPEANDEIAIVDASAATTKKITRADFLKGAALPADTVDTQAIADGAVTVDKPDFTTFVGGTWSKDLTQTYTSVTTMGSHTMYYRNIGGVIEVWGKTPAALVGNTTILVQIPFPPGLFASSANIQSAIVSASDHTQSASGYAQVNNATDVRLYVALVGTIANQNMRVNYYVRGI